MDTRQLIIYRDFKDQALFDGMADLLCKTGEQKEYGRTGPILVFWPIS